jgi:thiosulfate reductase/polysulfide reductase chain A
MTQSQNDPLLAELRPTNTVLINRSTAADMGIADGDEVYVESSIGKIKLPAELTEGIRPDCVAVDHGFGHWSQGYSVAEDRGANDGDLIPNLTIEEQLEYKAHGMPAMMEDVVVRVYRA